MYREWVRRDPEAPFARAMVAQTLARDGRVDEALAAIESSRAICALHPVISAAQQCLECALRGDRAGALAAIPSDVAALARTDESATWMFGGALALAGAREEAIDWLEAAMDRGLWAHEFIGRHDPLVASLREHPRFVRLIAEMQRRSEAFVA